MDLLIYGLVGIIAIAVIVESLKRMKASDTPVTPSTQKEESGPYVSADESDPTSTGRMRAMPIKKAIQGETTESAGATNLKQPKVPAAGIKKRGQDTRSINHERVESTESGEFELPDPFSVEISDDIKE